MTQRNNINRSKTLIKIKKTIKSDKDEKEKITLISMEKTSSQENKIPKQRKKVTENDHSYENNTS